MATKKYTNNSEILENDLLTTENILDKDALEPTHFPETNPYRPGVSSLSLDDVLRDDHDGMFGGDSELSEVDLSDAESVRSENEEKNEKESVRQNKNQGQPFRQKGNYQRNVRSSSPDGPVDEGEIISDDESKYSSNASNNVRANYYGEDLEGINRSKSSRRRNGNLSNVNQLESESVQKVRNDFDAALRAISVPRRRRSEATDNSIEMANVVVNTMRTAYDNDVRSRERGETAVKKLKALRLLERCMVRADMHPILLDAGLLDIIKTWMEPQRPDAKLPLYDIRQRIFNLMLKLPVKRIHLESSKIGSLVRFYTSLSSEVPEIRKKAQDCINKWCRPILGLSDSYREMRLKECEVDLERINSNPIPLDNYNVDNSNSENAPSQLRRARVPSTVPVGYRVRPKDNLNTPFDSDPMKRKSEDALSFERMLKKLKRKR